MIYNIDEVLNKLKKKGPSLPLDAIKKSFSIGSGRDRQFAPSHGKTVARVEKSEFEKDLEGIRRESNEFAETLKEYEGKKPLNVG